MDRGRGRGETDGWRGKGEVREKAVSSAEAKAVLQIQTHLLSYKVKWKGQECEPCLLNEKQNCSNGLVFTICKSPQWQSEGSAESLCLYL